MINTLVEKHPGFNFTLPEEFPWHRVTQAHLRARGEKLAVAALAQHKIKGRPDLSSLRLALVTLAGEARVMEE